LRDGHGPAESGLNSGHDEAAILLYLVGEIGLQGRSVGHRTHNLVALEIDMEDRRQSDRLRVILDAGGTGRAVEAPIGFANERLHVLGGGAGRGQANKRHTERADQSSLPSHIRSS
jgi:hypothetical protein